MSAGTRASAVHSLVDARRRPGRMPQDRAPGGAQPGVPGRRLSRLREAGRPGVGAGAMAGPSHAGTAGPSVTGVCEPGRGGGRWPVRRRLRGAARGPRRPLPPVAARAVHRVGTFAAR